MRRATWRAMSTPQEFQKVTLFVSATGAETVSVPKRSRISHAASPRVYRYTYTHRR